MPKINWCAFFAIFQHCPINKPLIFCSMTSLPVSFLSFWQEILLFKITMYLFSYHSYGWMIIFGCITFSWILLTEYSTTMCHPCRQAIISHQDLLHLNSKPFMKIVKVLNPIILNVILPFSFPVRHLPALFCYLLNPCIHSFLKVFIISQLICNIFQLFCFSGMPFPNTQKFFTLFSIWYII